MGRGGVGWAPYGADASDEMIELARTRRPDTSLMRTKSTIRTPGELSMPATPDLRYKFNFVVLK